jgi:hypothetical protein
MDSRDDAPDAAYRAAIERLDKSTALVRKREAAVDAARVAAGQDAVEAARLGLELGKARMRTEVLRHSPFSHTTLRDIFDAAGIPPDERYSRKVQGKGAGD